MIATPAYLLTMVDEQLPDFATQLRQTTDAQRLHGFFNHFATYTRHWLTLADDQQATRCLSLANTFYRTGGPDVCHALEVSYLYALHLDDSSAMLARARQLLSPELLRCQRRMEYSLLP